MTPKLYWRRIVSILCVLLGVPATLTAQASPDAPATIVIFPHLRVSTAEGIDTVVQLSNVSTFAPTISCFYVAADRACSPTSFRVNLTRDQPISWRVGRGLSEFPLTRRTGPGGQGNEGSLIPPVPSDPFEGSLACVAYDLATRQPLSRDVLIGTATIERFDGVGFDAASYNAIGMRSLPDAPRRPGPIVLGGTFGDYQSCARTLGALHYFDDGLDAPTKTSHVTTRFVIVPCTLDLSRPLEQQLSLQYEVTNEFEQRLAVRREQVGCEQPGSLSSIDASSPERSIFNAAVAGTLTGQTRVYANDGTVGLVAVGIETQRKASDPASARSTAFSLYGVGQPRGSDVITPPGLTVYPLCHADCDNDARVTVDELQLCVGIGLGEMAPGACPACDENGNRGVSVDEIISAVDNALNGCR